MEEFIMAGAVVLAGIILFSVEFIVWRVRFGKFTDEVQRLTEEISRELGDEKESREKTTDGR